MNYQKQIMKTILFKITLKKKIPRNKLNQAEERPTL